MTHPHHVSVNGLSIGNDLPLAVIAGPCVMESRQHALETAQALAEMARDLDVGLIYKSSFDKANRTSLEGARGIGMDAALPIFAEIESSWACRRSPTCTMLSSARWSPRWWTCCRSRRFCAGRPTFLLPRQKAGRST